MAILPGLTNEFYRSKYNSYLTVIILAYTNIFLYSLLLALAFWNIYSFLWKQKKWRIYSLSLFYFFAVCCILIRIFYAIFVVPICLNWYLFMFISTAAFKIFLGLAHIMIVLELSIRVEQSLLIYD